MPQDRHGLTDGEEEKQQKKGRRIHMEERRKENRRGVEETADKVAPEERCKNKKGGRKG